AYYMEKGWRPLDCILAPAAEGVKNSLPLVVTNRRSTDQHKRTVGANAEALEISLSFS
ncbi:hypothetical protein HAX54_041870, partial [Datura stramonium]|nr:hypothetical protein [Datura stramonium]